MTNLQLASKHANSGFPLMMKMAFSENELIFVITSTIMKIQESSLMGQKL